MLYLKYLLYVLVALVVLACSNTPATGVPKPNRVVIICNKDRVYADTLYLTSDKNGPIIHAAQPRVFDIYNELFEEIKIDDRVQNDTILFHTQANYHIIGYHYNPLEIINFTAFNGDTILIDNSDYTPKISLKNRVAWGVNYDWERERRFGRLYGYTPETLVNAEPILFLKSMREKFDFTSAKIKVDQAMQNNNRSESLWLDSLYRVNRLDSIEYRYYKARNHYQHLNLKLGTATKEELKNILSTYCDSTYRNDFYLFYHNFYDAVTRKYYYDKIIQVSNGSDYDFKDAYQRIEQDTLLRGRLRDVHLSHCFRKIDEIFSITDGKKYYDKVIKSIADTAISNALHRDYDKVYAQDIAFSDDLMLQNTEGVATTLQKVLAANVGKIIYIDFWASWCAPCMAGMPASKKLREEYKNKDVIFIYLAFNDKEQAWKTAISKAALSDVKNVYLVTNPRTSKVVDNLKLKTIPRYLVYDKKGQLVNSNAPRPESDEIRNMLNSLAKAE